jgi:hypothetical protein
MMETFPEDQEMLYNHAYQSYKGLTPIQFAGQVTGEVCAAGAIAAGLAYLGREAVTFGAARLGATITSAVTAAAKTGIQYCKSLISGGTKTSTAVSKSVIREGVKPNLDKLSKAGQTMDRGGLTKAGRSLDKHGGRSGSVFPKATGNPASKNAQGQYHLDDILTHPNSIIKQHMRPKYGEVIDYRIPGDRGVRFSKNGDFIMFLEP